MLYPKFKAWVWADDKWKPATANARSWAWAAWRQTVTVLRLVVAYAVMHPGTWYGEEAVQERWITQVMSLQARGFQRLTPHLTRGEVSNPLVSTGEWPRAPWRG